MEEGIDIIRTIGIQLPFLALLLAGGIYYIKSLRKDKKAAEDERKEMTTEVIKVTTGYIELMDSIMIKMGGIIEDSVEKANTKYGSEVPVRIASIDDQLSHIRANQEAMRSTQETIRNNQEGILVRIKSLNSGEK